MCIFHHSPVHASSIDFDQGFVGDGIQMSDFHCCKHAVEYVEKFMETLAKTSTDLCMANSNMPPTNVGNTESNSFTVITIFLRYPKV